MITSDSVQQFKTAYCDENSTISQLLASQLAGYFMEPILDVGSGMGDITARAFPAKEVIHLDVNDFSEYKLPNRHKRLITDFFKYTSDSIHTVLFCHALQFLDDDINKLNQKVSQIDPVNIVTVTNTNKDFLGELVKWFEKSIKISNPEVALEGFPKGYSNERVVHFAAILQCPDYDVLAGQVAYLFDCRLSVLEKKKLVEYLNFELDEPKFTIKQKIQAYVKEQ